MAGRAPCARAQFSASSREIKPAPIGREQHGEEIQNSRPARQILRSQLWFDNPGQSRHDRALSRALPQLRPDRARSCAPASRSSASRRPAPTCRPATAITSSWRKRVRDGIRTAGGIAFEFPVHPIQETGKRPTAALDRNLAYLGLVEVLYGYPLDGVVLTTGCDKTTPACIMAAATVNIPAIVLSGGPMLNGWWKGERSRLRHGGVEGARGTRRRPDRRRGIHRDRRRRRRRRSATATPWAPPRP